MTEQEAKEADDKQRRLFQKIKSMTQAQFNATMFNLFKEYYGLAENHFVEAMEIELQPKQRARVIAKAKEIKELWDGVF